jgi:hypothetical protein
VSARRLAARALLVAGALALGLLVTRSAPRDVVLVYGLDRPAASIEVEIRRGPELLRRAELRPGDATTVRHPVKLPDGEYLLRLRVVPQGAPPFVAERAITVTESAPIVLPLRR